jgi:PadR family transcriptional regulator, regulatory protein PadR
MPHPVRMSQQTIALFRAFFAHPRDWRYGYDLSRETALKSGTLYPLLMRLNKRGWLETRWVEPESPGRPPRHMYRLTSDGLRSAREAVAAKAAHAPGRRAAYGASRA